MRPSFGDEAPVPAAERPEFRSRERDGSHAVALFSEYVAARWNEPAR